MSDINVADTIREGLRSAGEGDFGEAKKKLLLATQQDPENSKAHYNLGVVLCQLGSESKAIKHYTAAINLEPFYKQALMELSRLELRQGRVEEADVLLRRALSKHPYDPELLNSLGNVLMIQGNSGQAKNAYEEALKYNEALPEALANLGMIYESEGDLPAALESYQRAYKLNPNLPRGLENLSYLAQHFCDWDLLDELLPKLEKKRNKLLGKNKLPSESAFFHISVCDDLETNQKFMSSLSGDIESYALSRQPAFSDYPRLSKKIKIG